MFFYICFSSCYNLPMNACPPLFEFGMLGNGKRDAILKCFDSIATRRPCRTLITLFTFFATGRAFTLWWWWFHFFHFFHFHRCFNATGTR